MDINAFFSGYQFFTFIKRQTRFLKQYLSNWSEYLNTESHMYYLTIKKIRFLIYSFFAEILNFKLRRYTPEIDKKIKIAIKQQILGLEKNIFFNGEIYHVRICG